VIGRIYAIAINTFREAVRDRVLYGVLGFASAILLLTLALAELSLNEERRVVMDVGLASISIFSVVIAVFLGSSLLYKEIERKTLYVILPKPIDRWEFLVGKYFGIALTGTVFIAIMGSIQMWVASIQAEAPSAAVALVPVGLLAALGLGVWRAPDRTAVLLPWSALTFAAAAGLCATTDVELRSVVISLVLNVGEVMVLAAVALLFSSFSTPFLTGAFTTGVWLVGRAADDMASMESGVLGPGVQSLLRGLAEVVPNFNLFVPGRHTLETHAEAYGGPWADLSEAMGYGVLYTILLLVAAALVFRRRDFL